MRLTLRTLLAYLDDTLDPEEARLIGQKVAESPVAQELIERIKKVTRRRSLANPPVLGESSRLDPNSVAEYLDSKLGADELSQLEQTCLEDDVYLAEVAACHQILTLMLSEPTRVPPTAKQRMYRLVKGRESIPYRKPPVAPTDAKVDGRPEKHPESRRTRWPLYVGGAALMLVGLAFAVYLAWPQPQPLRKNGTKTLIAELPTSKLQTPKTTTTPTSKKGETPKNDSTVGTAKPDASKPDSSKPDVSKPEPVKPPPPPPEPVKKSLDSAPNLEPSKEQKEIGEFVSKSAALIENQDRTKDNWQTVLAKSRITSGHSLVSLPGSQSEIKLDSDVQITLWGNLLELLPLMEFESAIVPHVAPTGFDADLTIRRGRVELKNLKDGKSAKVRLRFRGEIWDLTLADKSEAILDLLVTFAEGTRFSRQSGGESPMAQVFLGLRKGHATLQVRELAPVKLTAPPGPALIGWDNKGKLQPPAILKEPLPHWNWTPPTKSPAKEAAAEMKSVVDALVSRLAEKGATPNLALLEMAEAQKPSFQLYAAFSLPAIDNIKPLVDSLDVVTQPALRGAAAISLRNWIARRSDNGLILHRMLVEKKGYSESQADAVLQLLHIFSREDVASPSTYELLFGYLDNEKLSVRELAHWHLLQLDPDGARLAMYDPLQDDRDAAINRWKKRLAEGKIPPKTLKADGGSRANPMGEPKPVKP